MKDKQETAETTVTISDQDLDSMFASDDLLKLREMEKDEDAVEDTGEDDNEDEEVMASEVVTEEEEEEEPEAKEDKLERMTPEQLKASYKNLEALVGRQGAELGELRKKVTEEKPAAEAKSGYTENDIPTMPDADLDLAIKTYEAYLSTPGKSIDDSDQYGINIVLYNKLLVESGLRKHTKSLDSKLVDSNNDNVAKRYNAKLALSSEEMSSVKQYALTKLSDDGKLTESDLDVALHKLFPAKFNKMIGDKERERVDKAKTTTPRLPGNASSPTKGVVSIDHVKNMDPDDLAEWIRVDATEEQIEELRRKKII